uniref:Fatty acid hydroxylase domain-containing protein n=1 Tax=Euplotes harpa TaxID=151035 RepID=A0A7S3ND61_9SPIT|mmetsp:Transcript_39036/g.44646  ORF Transcript_39036/g.44646 Transcript_39036/m.44646 type:complete len:198 (+) Transcript_39036:455-1048(+)
MRMFDSPYLEIFSVTPWYLIPIVWVPVILYTISLARQSFGWPALGVMFVVGAFLWTLIEYCLHRFLFHLELFIPDNRYLYTLHYVLHGVHHAFPMDGGRLVMPPVLGIPYYYLLYGIFSSLISMEVCHGLAVGVIFAYVCYDLGHYYFHHEQPIKWMEYRKKYHMYHHYKDPDNGYGITTSLWDTVFGTTYKNFKNS